MNIAAFDFSTVTSADYVMIPAGNFAHEAHKSETFIITLNVMGFEDADYSYEVQITNEHGLDMRRYLDDADFINPLEWALRALTNDDTLLVSKCESGMQTDDCAYFDITRK